jgi:hypothetical protein
VILLEAPILFEIPELPFGCNAEPGCRASRKSGYLMIEQDVPV